MSEKWKAVFLFALLFMTAVGCGLCVKDPSPVVVGSTAADFCLFLIWLFIAFDDRPRKF